MISQFIREQKRYSRDDLKKYLIVLRWMLLELLRY